MPGRRFAVEGYRYGFNGHESDDEIFGSNNSYDFGARMYNPRIGKTFSVDPWASKYSWQSPYGYHRNTPVWRIDWMGYGDPPGWWESFLVSSLKGIGQMYSYINNNPAHAGYAFNPKPVTMEQIEAYSIDWSQQIDPYYHISTTAAGMVGTVQGVYQFGAGIYEGDGAKSAQALPSVVMAGAMVYGFYGAVKYTGSGTARFTYSVSITSSRSIWARIRRKVFPRRHGKIIAEKRAAIDMAIANEQVAARDAAANLFRRKHATYAGGSKNGKVVAGRSKNPEGCAEDDIARQLGADAKMSGAKGWRKNTKKELEYIDIPVCTRCQSKYSKSQFPKDVKYDSGGAWD